MTHTEKISAIRSLPSELNNALQGMDETALDTPWREGGWTARQIVHHIADSHVNAFVRMKLIQTEDHPTLKPYDQDAWARTEDYRREIAPSVAIISGIQERMANLLEPARESDLSRSSHHPERGELTLQTLFDEIAWHGAHHVEQIRKVGAKILG